MRRAARNLNLTRIQATRYVPLKPVGPLLMRTLLRLVRRHTILTVRTRCTTGALRLLRRLRHLNVIRTGIIVNGMNLRQQRTHLTRNQGVNTIILVPLNRYRVGDMINHTNSINTTVPLNRNVKRNRTTVNHHMIRGNHHTTTNDHTHTNLGTVNYPVRTDPTLRIHITISGTKGRPTTHNILSNVINTQLGHYNSPRSLVTLRNGVNTTGPLKHRRHTIFSSSRGYSLLVSTINRIVGVQTNNGVLHCTSLSLSNVSIPRLMNAHFSRHGISTAFRGQTPTIFTLGARGYVRRFHQGRRQTQELAITHGARQVFTTALIGYAGRDLGEVQARRQLITQRGRTAFPITFSSPQGTHASTFTTRLTVIRRTQTVLILTGLDSLKPAHQGRSIGTPKGQVSNPNGRQLTVSVNGRLIETGPLTLTQDRGSTSGFRNSASPRAVMPVAHTTNVCVRDTCPTHPQYGGKRPTN